MGAATTGGPRPRRPRGAHGGARRDAAAARDPELPRARRRAPQPALRRGDGDRDQHVDARRVPRARRAPAREHRRSRRSTSRPPSRRSSARDGDGRFAQVLLPVRNDIPYGNRYYHPLYAAAHERGLPIALHAWGRGGNAPTTTGVTTTYLEDYASNAHIAQTQLMSLVAEGVFAEFPELDDRLRWSAASPGCRRCCGGSTRTGRACGARCRGSRSARRSTSGATCGSRPSPRSCRRPEQVAQVVEMVGPELLLYASDHPHDHGASSERAAARPGRRGRRGDPARQRGGVLRRFRGVKVVVCAPRGLPRRGAQDREGRATLDRGLQRGGRVLRHPQPLPAPGRTAVHRAAVAVGGRERPRQGDDGRAAAARRVPVARLGVRPRDRASRSWGRARRA